MGSHGSSNDKAVEGQQAGFTVAAGFSFPQPVVPSSQAAPLTAYSTVTAPGKTEAKIISTAVPQTRNKAPLEKGYSQVDWLRLSKATPKHPLRKGITLAEVKLHNTKEDAWMVFRNRVYNLTPYLRFHPGGVDILASMAGKDGTAQFMKYHPWVNIDALMEKCLVGLLAEPPGAQEQPPPPSSKVQPMQPSASPADPSPPLVSLGKPSLTKGSDSGLDGAKSSNSSPNLMGTSLSNISEVHAAQGLNAISDSHPIQGSQASLLDQGVSKSSPDQGLAEAHAAKARDAGVGAGQLRQGEVEGQSVQAQSEQGQGQGEGRADYKRPCESERE